MHDLGSIKITPSKRRIPSTLQEKFWRVTLETGSLRVPRITIFTFLCTNILEFTINLEIPGSIKVPNSMFHPTNHNAACCKNVFKTRSAKFLNLCACNPSPGLWSCVKDLNALFHSNLCRQCLSTLESSRKHDKSRKDGIDVSQNYPLID